MSDKIERTIVIFTGIFIIFSMLLGVVHIISAGELKEYCPAPGSYEYDWDCVEHCGYGPVKICVIILGGTYSCCEYEPPPFGNWFCGCNIN